MMSNKHRHDIRINLTLNYTVERSNTFLFCRLNKALVDCRPHNPLLVNLYAPDLCMRAGNVIFVFVLGCVYRVPVQWELRREKICNCEMVEVQIGISKWELRHTCIHRPLIEITPTSGTVTVPSYNTYIQIAHA